MATLFWRGGTSGDITVKANYVDSTGATPASAPANGDKLVFDQGTVDVDGGASSLTNMDIVGTPGYTGRFGAASAVGIGINTIRWGYSGSINIDGDITNGAIACADGRQFTYTGGTATDLYVENTPYQINGDVTNWRTRNARGSDTTSATGYTVAEHEGGSHRTRRGGKFDLDGGASLIVDQQGSLATGTRAAGRSMIDYRSAEAISGTVEIRPGSMLNATKSPGFDFSSGTLKRWTDARINLFTADGGEAPGTTTTVGLTEQTTTASFQQA